MSLLPNIEQVNSNVVNFPVVQPHTMHPAPTLLSVPSPSLSLVNSIPLEVALTDLGTQLKFLGHIEQGMAKYFQAIKVNPKYAPAYYNIGVIYSEAGHYEEALAYYQKAIEWNRLYVEAYCNIGVIYKNTGRLEEAVVYYDKALALNPNFTIARNNMAISLTDLGTKLKTEGDVKKGVALYKRALMYNSQYPDAYYNLGVAYGEARKYDRATWYYELAIHFNPYCCEAYNNLGVIYKEQDNLDKAIMCYQAALAINPKFSQSLNNIGVVYTVQGKLDEAYLYVHNAIEENPHYSEAYNNLGVLYRDEGLIAEAIKCYEKCLAINPLSRNAGQNRLLAMNYLPQIDNRKVYIAHKDWGELFVQQFTQYTEYLNRLDPNRILRIGYISPDFFVHSVSYFIDAILANHNQEKYHVICYSNVVKEDTKTFKLRQYAYDWKTITGMDTKQVASLIYDDCIDILVELAGHTSGNRLDVMAMRPAPIQVTWIGYPNTSGLPTIDYRLTDEISDPQESDQQYVEKLVKLPTGFLCYSPSLEAGEVSLPPMLTKGYVTFGSFNNLAKINHRVLDLWTRIMHILPDSHLVMKCKPFACESVKRKFIKKFEDHGIDANRLTLISLMPMNSDHMQSYSLMDISLDTFPYAGTTTTCESLWMGVPVVTLVGNCHAHNVGASILTQIGHIDWITTTVDEYVDMAVRLASDPEQLSQIRANLRSRMIKSPLCNGKTFTQHLETTYRKMWKSYVKSEGEVYASQAQDGADLGVFQAGTSSTARFANSNGNSSTSHYADGGEVE
jgi:protein O-GlcNAc transferase